MTAKFLKWKAPKKKRNLAPLDFLYTSPPAVVAHGFSVAAVQPIRARQVDWKVLDRKLMQRTFPARLRRSSDWFPIVPRQVADTRASER